MLGISSVLLFLELFAIERFSLLVYNIIILLDLRMG